MTICEVVASIEQVDAQEWDALCGGRAFVQHRWLRLLAAIQHEYRPRYLLLREHGQLQAAAICSIRAGFQNAFLRTRANWLVERFPCLRCGTPVFFDDGLLVRRGSDATLWLPRLLAALDRYAAQERLSFVSLDHLTADHALWALPDARRYHRADLLTEVMLDGTWDSFSAYSASLRGDFRRRLRRIQQRAQKEGITVEPQPMTPELAAHLRVLSRAVYAAHGDPDPYIEDLWGTAAALLGDDMQVLVARRGAQVIGAVSALWSEGELASKWIGLDYEQTRGTATYLALTIALIERGIKLGAHRVRLGATNYEAKREFGAVMEPRAAALKLRSRALNRLAGTALTLVRGRAIETHSAARDQQTAVPSAPRPVEQSPP